MSASSSSSLAPRALPAAAPLADLLYALSVNFLLYACLILVFYMLVRFYLEEDIALPPGYAPVPLSDDEAEGAAEGAALEGKNAALEGQNGPSDGLNASPEGLNASSEVGDKPLRKTGSFLNINEWGEPEGTKQEVLQRVFYCALGLVLAFSIWGLAQERMLTQTYNGDFFIYSYGLVFFTRVGGLILSLVLMYYFDVEWQSAALWEYSFPSVANMLSSWCQYEALRYVSFPTVMLAKAFKMVPVMLMGVLMNNKSYETYEYVSGATVGFGLYIFITSSENLKWGENVFGDWEGIHGAACGVVLLLFFLLFDSATGQWQTRMFQLNKNLSPLQMMLITNAFSAVFSFITLVHQEELSKCLTFVYEHPGMIFHLLVFIVTSTVGQLFIFYTVKHFGAVVFAVIMSIRIFCSTLLSCFVYSHSINELGVLGMIIVFGAIAYRIRRKIEGSSLIRWKDAHQSRTVFKEWHEHLDV